MMLFRSEDEVTQWRFEQGRETGAILPVTELPRLGELWYGDRLDPEWRPRSREQSQAILDAAGLTDPFWQLP